jgi:hypothetical protein
MPFGTFRSQPKYQIDFDHETPVAVLANFSVSGKYYPAIIKHELPDQSIVTYHIDKVKVTKTYDNYDMFYCFVTNFGRQNEIIVKYHFMQHIWTIAI